MLMLPRLRKAVLTTHITFSVGWLGAVVVFLVLAITGLNSEDTQLARASLLAMKLSAWFVILPFCLLSLFTGIVQAIGTKWGLFKHYWIVVKLFLTVISTLLLILHLQPINALAEIGRDTSFPPTQHAEQIINIISKTGAAIIALLVITTISIYKPWGKISKNQEPKKELLEMSEKKKPVSYYILIGLLCLLAIVVIMHLFGGGIRH